MTTKVNVTNHGPSPVQVKIMDRKRRYDGSTSRLESKYRGPPLPVGQTQEHYVHAGQELHVVELQADNYTEVEPHR